MTDPTPDVPTLRRLLAEATQGPYRSAEQLHGEWFGIQSEHFALGTAFHPADAALIVAAVNALPGVLDRLEAAEGAVARVDIEAVLSAHQWRDLLGDYEIAPFYKHFGCSCGWEQDIAGMSGWRSWIAAHRAHVAATLCAALAEVTP